MCVTHHLERRHTQKVSSLEVPGSLFVRSLAIHKASLPLFHSSVRKPENNSRKREISRKAEIVLDRGVEGRQNVESEDLNDNSATELNEEKPCYLPRKSSSRLTFLALMRSVYCKPLVALFCVRSIRVV
jgi:hypothetical protein